MIKIIFFIFLSFQAGALDIQSERFDQEDLTYYKTLDALEGLNEEYRDLKEELTRRTKNLFRIVFNNETEEEYFVDVEVNKLSRAQIFLFQKRKQVSSDALVLNGKYDIHIVIRDKKTKHILKKVNKSILNLGFQRERNLNVTLRKKQELEVEFDDEV